MASQAASALSSAGESLELGFGVDAAAARARSPSAFTALAADTRSVGVVAASAAPARDKSTCTVLYVYKRTNMYYR